MELIRSLVFVPGNRANMLERARSFDADVIMVDLEDSVPPGEKVAARDMAREWVPALRAEGKRVMVRVNSLDTGLTRAELETVVSLDLYGVSLGKVESVRDIRTLDSLLIPLEASAGLKAGSLRVIPWIETAKAAWDARAIAESSPRVVAIAFGAEDFTNDMGIERTDTGEEVAVPRAWVPVAARAAEVGALDSPFVRFRAPRRPARGRRAGAADGLYRQVRYSSSPVGNHQRDFSAHPRKKSSTPAVWSRHGTPQRPAGAARWPLTAGWLTCLWSSGRRICWPWPRPSAKPGRMAWRRNA